MNAIRITLSVAVCVLGACGEGSEAGDVQADANPEVDAIAEASEVEATAEVDGIGEVDGIAEAAEVEGIDADATEPDSEGTDTEADTSEADTSEVDTSEVADVAPEVMPEVVVDLCADKVCDAPPRVDVATACAAGGTFEVFLGEGCGGACEPTTGACVYTPTTLPCPDADTKLAHTHGWQVALRAGLADMAEADLDVALVPLSFEAAWLDDPDILFPLWVAADRGWYTLPPSDGLRHPTRSFTLAHIEQPDGVRGGQSQAEVNGMLFWYRWTYPGNPHHLAPAVARRAFVMASVDLIMIDTEHGDGMVRAQQHFLSGTMNWLSGAYHDGHTHVAACTAAAYRLGLQTMFERLEAWDNNNGNNDMAQPGHLALYEAAVAMPDPSWLERAEIESREIFTDVADGGYWHEEAGYFDHGVALDSSYEGITTHMLAAAANGIPWPHLADALTKYMRLKARMILPEPDGVTFTSPSHWNPATAAGASDDQWHNYHREVAAAMVTDEAAYLLVGGRGVNIGYDPFDLTAMRDSVLALLPSLDAKLTTPLPDHAANPWVPLHWSNGRNAAVSSYRPGFYAHLTTLKDTPAMLPWVARGELGIESFADDFTIARFEDYAAIIYTGPIADSWAVDMAGMGGGALSAFWTPAGGTFLLGLTHGSQNPAPDAWTDVRNWPMQHLYGLTPEGHAWSTAMVQRPLRSADALAVTGAIGPEAWSVPEALTQTPTYRRTFVLTDGGVSVTTTLTTDALNTCELVDVVPLYDRGVYQDPAASPVIVFITADDQRVPATTDWVDAVAVEVRRFEGTVRVALDHERRVRMAPAQWVNNYQTYVQATALHIDALGVDGCVELPGETTITWTISAVP